MDRFRTGGKEDSDQMIENIRSPEAPQHPQTFCWLQVEFLDNGGARHEENIYLMECCIYKNIKKTWIIWFECFTES